MKQKITITTIEEITFPALEVSTLETPGIIKNVRGVGNTTRQVNFAVEKLYEGYKVIVQDHYPRWDSNKFLFARILSRLSAENQLELLVKNNRIEIDFVKFTIELV